MRTDHYISVLISAAAPLLCAADQPVHGYAADFNRDGELTATDLAGFHAAFTAGDRRADFNGDRTVGADDYVAFRAAYLSGGGAGVASRSSLSVFSTFDITTNDMPDPWTSNGDTGFSSVWEVDSYGRTTVTTYAGDLGQGHAIRLLGAGDSGKELEDGAIRASWRGGSTSTLQLHARCNGQSGSSFKGLFVEIQESGTPNWRVVEVSGGSSTDLATGSLDSKYKPSKRSTYELAVRGDEWAFRANGEEIGTGTFSTANVPAGWWGVGAGASGVAWDDVYIREADADLPRPIFGLAASGLGSNATSNYCSVRDPWFTVTNLAAEVQDAFEDSTGVSALYDPNTGEGVEHLLFLWPFGAADADNGYWLGNDYYISGVHPVTGNPRHITPLNPAEYDAGVAWMAANEPGLMGPTELAAHEAYRDAIIAVMGDYAATMPGTVYSYIGPPSDNTGTTDLAVDAVTEDLEAEGLAVVYDIVTAQSLGIDDASHPVRRSVDRMRARDTAVGLEGIVSAGYNNYGWLRPDLDTVWLTKQQWESHLGTSPYPDRTVIEPLRIAVIVQTGGANGIANGTERYEYCRKLMLRYGVSCFTGINPGGGSTAAMDLAEVYELARIARELERGTQGPSFAATATQPVVFGQNSWSNVSYATGSPDNAVATGTETSTVNLRDLKTSFSFSVPTGATINGVEATFRARVSTSPCAGIGLETTLTDGSAIRVQKPLVELTGTLAEYTVGGPWDTWGADLTDSIVNGGLEVHLTPVSNGTTATFEIDSVSVKVYYTTD